MIPADEMPRIPMSYIVNDAAHADPIAPPPAPAKAKPVKISPTDVTVGLSRSQRRLVSFTVWLSSPTAHKVWRRESKGICSITNPSGKYQGKWQMDDSFWRSYGGLAFAPNPHQAPCAAQDGVAYRGWLARGWSPWTTA